MPLTRTPMHTFPQPLPTRPPAPPDPVVARLAELGAKSNEPRTQAAIRDGVRRGVYRVRPAPGDPTRVVVERATPDPFADRD